MRPETDLSQLGIAMTIDVEGLIKRFGEVEAVVGVTFAVRRGELFGFLGPNVLELFSLPDDLSVRAVFPHRETARVPPPTLLRVAFNLRC